MKKNNIKSYQVSVEFNDFYIRYTKKHKYIILSCNKFDNA